MLFDRLEKRRTEVIGESGRLVRALFLRGWIALNQDGRNPEIARGFDVGERVSDEQAVGSGRLREIRKGLQEHSDPGFAAVALAFVMRAVVEGVDVRGADTKMFLESRMEGIDVRGRVESKGNAALVAHHDHAFAGDIERGDGCFSTGKELHILPVADVFAFRRLAVDDAIAIEEDVADVLETGVHRHATCMITKNPRSSNLRNMGTVIS
jgi:hypothetical protein